MRVTLWLAIVLVTGCAGISETKNTDSGSWHTVFAHDSNGAATQGSKQALVDAVRAGKPIRVYWAGRRVEHVADAFFLTILGGEVFAQIETIQGQAPSDDPPAIEFRDNQWRTILSTNGDRALTWFTTR
ncbi:MAG: hypothetical protein AAFX44_17465 [Pseudomonadota bacterium]